MPLFENATELLRRQLEEIERGNRVKALIVGKLTAAQLAAINGERAREGQAPIIDEILFLGTHLYRSRVGKDGYTIDDVIDQITNALDEAAEVIANPKMTTMRNRKPRADRYGNQVYDVVVFECTSRHPRPELYSVIPKGDAKKPKGQP